MRNFRINWNFFLLLLLLGIAQFSSVLSKESSDVPLDESMYSSLECKQTIELGKSGKDVQLFRLQSLAPPFLCIWNFETGDKRPFQVEIHQLKNIGRWDHLNKTCIGGFVQFSEAQEKAEEKDGISWTATKLCDDQSDNKTRQNGLSTPFYAARGVLWVSIEIPEPLNAATKLAPKLNIVTTVAPLQQLNRAKSQFPQVPVGGSFMKESDCKILFTNCAEEECFISSENYPGVQMKHQACHYIFRTSMKTDRIRMKFQMSVVKPHDCTTDFISISSSHLSPSLSTIDRTITRICEPSSVVEIEAVTDIIVQYYTTMEKPFPSGLQSGTFYGRIRFIHAETGDFQAPGGNEWRAAYQDQKFNRKGNVTREKLEFMQENMVYFSGSGTGTGTETGDGADWTPISNRQIPIKAEFISTVFCGNKIDGKFSRAGRFQLLVQPPQKWEKQLKTSYSFSEFGSESQSESENYSYSFNCGLFFSGNSFDLISITICTHDFDRDSNLKSDDEFFFANEKVDGSKNLKSEEICEEINLNSYGKLIFQMKLTPPSKLLKGRETNTAQVKSVTGTFVFHDQQVEGSFTSLSRKDETIFKDGKVSSRGQLLGPPPLHFLNSSNRTKTTTTTPETTSSISSSALLIPGKNHLVSVELKRANSYGQYMDLRHGKGYCQSFCSSSCECKIHGATKMDDSFDRISFKVGTGAGEKERERDISCFCGLSPETPFKIYADTPLRINYHMSNENQNQISQSEMTYAAQYEFLDGKICPDLALNFDTEKSKGVGLKPKIGEDGNLWSFRCSWDFNIYPRTDTQLFLTAIGETSQDDDAPCQFSSWNISVIFYISKQRGWLAPEMFCSEDKFKEITFPSLARKGRISMAGIVAHAPEIWLNWTVTETETEDDMKKEKQLDKLELKVQMMETEEFDWRTDAVWSGSVAMGILILWTLVVCLICRLKQRYNISHSENQLHREQRSIRERGAKSQGFRRLENTVIYPDDRY